MQQWQLKITLKVSDNWIEDGFDLNPAWLNTLKEYFEQEMLPFSNEGEVEADIRVTDAPDPHDIKKLQGLM